MQRCDLIFETDRFNLSDVKPHFINPCCFGEDLAAWLRDRLTERGMTVTEPDQEDWGWYIEATFNDQAYFIGIGGNASDNGHGPNHGEWRIMVQRHQTFLQRLTGRNKMDDEDALFVIIQRLLRQESTFANVHVER